MQSNSSILWQVFWVALLTDFATGLGALPFLFVRNFTPRWQGIASAFAGGMMISAGVFSLAEEGLARGTAWQVIVGILAGAAFFSLTARFLHRQDASEDADVVAERRSMLLVAVMFIHSIPEGLAIGVGYATGELGFGILLALAIAFHNIPEGIAVSLPLRSRGVSVWKCFWYSVLTSVPQPIVAVPAYLLVSYARPLLVPGLGFAGGAMIFIVVADLLPESFEKCSKEEAAWGVVVGLVVMLAITAGIRH